MKTRGRSTSIDMDIATRIRRLRSAKGLSQGALGAALGVTFQQVQKYENGINRVAAGRLVTIARVIGVPVASLLPPEEGAADERDSLLAKVTRVRDALAAKLAEIREVSGARP